MIIIIFYFIFLLQMCFNFNLKHFLLIQKKERVKFEWQRWATILVNYHSYFDRRTFQVLVSKCFAASVFSVRYSYREDHMQLPSFPNDLLFRTRYDISVFGTSTLS